MLRKVLPHTLVFENVIMRHSVEVMLASAPLPSTPSTGAIFRDIALKMQRLVRVAASSGSLAGLR